MKHLNLELEKLEQRIAPGAVCHSGGHSGGGSKGGGSKGGGSNGQGSKGGGSNGSGGSKGSKCR
jgi:hypothetical protein